MDLHPDSSFPQRHEITKPNRMKIGIHDTLKVSAIQEAFSHLFPYLKLEFYSRTHKDGAGSAVKFLKSEDAVLGDFRKTHTTGDLDIDSNMTVSDLEQAFGETYGVGVQVFRKSGNIWLQTTITDGWTLGKQNTEGELLSRHDQ